MKRCRRHVALALGALVVVAGAARAQATTNSTASPLGRALMAERNGAWADAAAQYQAVLAADPANVGALLGMEHVLPHLDRQSGLPSLIGRALASDSNGLGVLGVAVRVYTRLGMADSARRYVTRWSRLAPRDEDPFREWYQAAIAARDMAQARAALDLGRERLGVGALGIERGEFFERTGDIAAAVDAWVGVVRATPVMRDAAVSMLTQVAANQRADVLAALSHNASVEGRQMLAVLAATWGDPGAAVAAARGALPPDRDAAALLLRHLDSIVDARGDKASRAASAALLEILAPLGPDSLYGTTLLAAARAWAGAGDEQNARRVLAVVAARPGSGAGGDVSVTQLEVFIAAGNADASERVLRQLGNRIEPDQHDSFARRIAVLWIRRGNLDRADTLVAADSSIQGLDLRGRLRLYRGDLAGANDLLKVAGPYDDVRDDAIARVAVLTLIQAVGRDTAPSLGTALLAAERGDTAAAVRGLAALAATLKGDGAAETRLFAARLALDGRDSSAAVGLLHAADVADAPGPAAAARLALANISLAAGRRDEARGILERLIVDFPESAVVPEARRLHDRLTGAVPDGGR